MSQFTFSTAAYAKMVLHACEWPHAPVSGILLASSAHGISESVLCVDALPLFHSAPLGPLLDVGFNMVRNHSLSCFHSRLIASWGAQASHFAEKRGWSIAGLYFAAEALEDNDLPSVVARIGAQIRSVVSTAVVFVVDNMKLRRGDEIAGSLFISSSGKWQRSNASMLLEDSHGLDVPKRLLEKRPQVHIVDFEEHVEDPGADWANSSLDLGSAKKAE